MIRSPWLTDRPTDQPQTGPASEELGGCLFSGDHSFAGRLEVSWSDPDHFGPRVQARFRFVHPPQIEDLVTVASLDWCFLPDCAQNLLLFPLRWGRVYLESLDVSVSSGALDVIVDLTTPPGGARWLKGQEVQTPDIS